MQQFEIPKASRALHWGLCSLILWLLFGWIGPPCYAESEQAKMLFQEALMCYGEINFACTLEKLEQAREIEEKTSADTDLLIEIHRFRAYSLVALDRTEAAKDAFRDIFALNPGFDLSESKVSPKIYQVFLQVKAQQPAPEPEPIQQPDPIPEPESIPEEKPLPEPIPEPDPWIRPERLFGFSLKAAILLGEEDRDAYHAGLAMDVTFEHQLANGFYLGAALGYQRHEGKGGNDALNALNLQLQPAYLFVKNRFLLHIPIGLGVGIFGRGGVADEVGLAWKAEPGAYWRALPELALGTTIGTGGMILFDPARSSSYFTIGLSLLGSW